MPALEDVALVRALRRHDVAIRHSPAVRVWTSARCVGRTPHGLAATLRRWTETAARDGAGSDPQRVESPAALTSRVRLRRALRELWEVVHVHGGRGIDRDALRFAARELNLSPEVVLTELASRKVPFGALHERLLALGWPAHTQLPLVNVATAIPELRARVRILTGRGEEADDAIAA